MCEVLDRGTAFRAGDDEGSHCGTVEHDRKVHLVHKVHLLGEQESVYRLPLRPGLLGHKTVAEHLAGVLGDLGGLDDVDATLETVRERPQPAPTSEDLRLDHNLLVAYLLGGCHSLVHTLGGDAVGHVDALGGHQLRALVLVDVQMTQKLPRRPQRPPGMAQHAFGADPAFTLFRACDEGKTWNGGFPYKPLCTNRLFWGAAT